MRKREDSNTTLVDKTRRRFFRFFLSETMCLVDEIRGKPQMRLSELDQVPDDVVRKMIPVFGKRCPYRIEGDRLLIEHKKTGLFEEIYHLDPAEMYILPCFDGHHSLEDIGRHLEDRFDQDKEEAYQRVKSLFVVLAKRMVCYPANVHD
jgi:hypothetical protein